MPFLDSRLFVCFFLFLSLFSVFSVSALVCPVGTLFDSSTSSCLPCPVGAYCPTNSTSIPCPAGSFSTGGSVLSCTLCSAGFSCSGGLSALPQACSAGYWSPVNSSQCIACGPGFFCSDRSLPPVSCSAGFYSSAVANSLCSPCPPGFQCSSRSSAVACPATSYSSEGSAFCSQCPFGYYCPAQSSAPLPCPAGTLGSTSLAARSTLASGCPACPGGTYSSNTSDAVCSLCPGGYVCTGGTNSARPTDLATQFGRRCPSGFYCPPGTGSADQPPQPCPIGRYQPSEGASNSSSCLLCPSGSYGDSAGQSACIPCGSSASSLPGSSSCQCFGLYRSYQKSDGSCLCSTGYEYFDSQNRRYAGDSPFDCQPILVKECGDKVRNASGACIDSSDSACDAACSGSASSIGAAAPNGQYDSSLGLCICKSADVTQICNSTCQASLPVISFTSDRSVLVLSPASSSASARLYSSPLSSLPGFEGSMSCPSVSTTSAANSNLRGCRIQSIVASSSGQRAIFGVPPSIRSALNLPSNFSLFAASSSGAFHLMNAAEPVAVASSEPRFHPLSVESSLSSDSVDSDLVSDYLPFSPRSLASISYSFYSDPVTRAPAVLNPAICLLAGDSLVWDLVDPAHYPVYDKDNRLNSNSAFDWGAFRTLAAKLSAGITVNTFGFTFTDVGTYVFSDAAQPELRTIVAVLASTSTCPSSLQVLPSSASTLTALGVSQRQSFTVEPDLTIIWALIGCFLALTLIVALVARLKQNRARREAELANEGNEESKDNFKLLYEELKSQKRGNAELFRKQKEGFRAECDRIAAETEQIKALLAVKLTDGRGFIDAAINLLLAEITARSAFSGRQKRREDEMVGELRVLNQLLEDPECSTETLKRQSEAVEKRLLDVIREAERERQRREHLSANAGIIGEDIVQRLTEHEHEDSLRESALLAKLKQFKVACSNFRAEVLESEIENEERMRELAERRNHAALEAARQKHERRVRQLASMLLDDLTRLLAVLGDMLKDIKLARELSEEDENDALDILEQRKLEILQQQQQGIFKDLDDELAEAIKFFLGQARRDLMPGYAGSMEPGAPLALLDDPLAKPRAAQGAGSSEDARPNELEVLSAVSEEVKSSAEAQFERERQDLINNSDVSAEELRAMYEDLRRREAALEQLQRAEETRQRQMAEQLFAVRNLDQEDEMILARAREMFSQMVDKHRREEEELHAKLVSDEEARVAAEMAQLAAAERAVEEKKRQLELEMNRKNEAAASESEKTEIAHEHLVQLKNLEESLKQDRMNSQRQLSKIHEDMRAKLRAAKRDIRERQQASAKAAADEYEKVRATVEAKAEERAVRIEGIDLTRVQEEIQKAKEKPNAKAQAMQQFHQQAQQELVKKQRAAERGLIEELDRERENAVRMLELKYREREEEEISELQAALAREREAVEDRGRLAELEAQHNELVKARVAELEQEKNAARAELLEVLDKKKSAKLEELNQEHKIELEKEMQEQKKEQENLVRNLVKRKEVEALQPLLTVQNRRKAKAIIERIIKPRHAKESAVLLQENFREANAMLQENLNKAFEEAAAQRSAIEERLQNGEIDEEESKRLESEVNQRLNPEKIQQETLKLLEVKHNAAIESQRSEQFLEIKDIMKKFYPDEDFSTAEWKFEQLDLKAILAQAEAKKRAAEEKIQQEIKELERKEAEALQEFEKKKAAKLAELEQKLEEENAKLEAQFKEKMENERRIKQEKLREMEEENRKLMELAASEEEKSLIQQRFQLQLQAETAATQEAEAKRAKVFQNKLFQQAEQAKIAELARMEEEQQRQIAIQQANKQAEQERLKKIAEEKELRKQEMMNKAAKYLNQAGEEYAQQRKNGMKLAASRMKKMLNKQMTNIKLMGEAAKLSLGVGAGMMGQIAGQSAAAAGQPASGAALANAVNLSYLLGGRFPGVGAEGQPFLQKLDRLEEILVKMLRTGDGQFRGERSGAAAGFDDDKLSLDPQLTDPVVAPLSDLSAKRFVFYRFGVFLFDSLTSAFNEAPVKFLLAKSLPAKRRDRAWTENAFQHSFHYDEASRTAFIRLERAEEIGEFSLIAVHGLSHILAQEWSDYSPRFQRMFFKSVQFLAQMLFFSRSAPVSNAAALSFSSQFSSLASDSAEAAVEMRSALVDEYLDLQSRAAVDEFEPDLIERLDVYRSFQYSGPLKDFLIQLERKVAEKAKAKSLAAIENDGVLQDSAVDQKALERVQQKAKLAAAGDSAASAADLRSQLDFLHDALDRLNAELAEALALQEALSEQLKKVESAQASHQSRQLAKKIRSKLKKLRSQQSSIQEAISKKESAVEIKLRMLKTV